ncbi:MAG: polymer-forming cytoskeletal protein [Ignavibacteriaceae bacterium]|nr:polymer-forming cytoskeletal protein [Ignavibacteriaceae bacterium]
MNKDKRNELDAGVSIISPGVEIQGDIVTKGSVRIDGKITGNITAEGSITVGLNGEVRGDIKALSIIIDGKVTGTIYSQERLHLESHADIEGDLFVSKLIVEEGARFVGKSSMNKVKEIPDAN